MSAETRTGSVTGIYVVTDTLSSHYGQQLVNVATGGPDGTVGVVNSLPAYYPQVADSVVIQDLGGQWIVIGCLTPNRGPVLPTVPRVHIQNGGVPAGYSAISTWYFQTGVLDQPNLIAIPTAAVTPPTNGTIVFNANASRAYRYDFGGSWATGSDRPYQGIYSGFGPWAGEWYYTGLTAGLSGKTPTAIRMHIKRAGVGGSGGAVPLQLYLTTDATQPTGAPTLTTGPITPDNGYLSWNAIADVTLPLAWATALKAGTATGIGVYATDQASYSILAGVSEDATSGQLQIDYT